MATAPQPSRPDAIRPREQAIRVTWKPPVVREPPPSSDPLVMARRKSLRQLRRQRLGFWRSLQRSNRLFPRKLVVTREGKWIIGIALLLGAAAVNTGNNLLYLVLSLVISVIAVSGVLSELCLRDLEVRRRYPDELVAGEVSPLRLEVHNDKGRAALHIEVGEVIDDTEELQVRDGYLLHLGPRETGQAFAAIRPLRRGLIATVGLQLSTKYPFGFAAKARLFDDPAEFIALPGVLPVDLPWRGALDRGATEVSRKVGIGESFAGLRDARPGDPLRDIHWKISARRGRQIVREWQSEAARVAMVRFLHVAPLGPQDSQRQQDPLDQPRALDAACARVAGVCDALLRAGFAVGLQTLDGAVVPSAESAGRSDQLLQIRRHLAQLTIADRRPPATWPLSDDAWAAACRLADARAENLRRGEALPWAAAAASGPAEVFLVTFASRPDVRAAGACDVHIQLAPDGAVASIAEVRAPVAA